MEDVKSKVRAYATAGSLGAAMLLAGAASAPASAETPDILGLKNGAIGFALTSARWQVYQTAEVKECPQGFNDGPREQFKALYPNGGTVEGTQLERESASRYPTDKEDSFPYREIQGTVGLGLNLDGKIDDNDFTSPDGEKGIDNQLYRALGCTRLFRGPDGTYSHFTELWVREMNHNRILIELSDVDSLENDDHVVVVMYRGKDNLMMDASATTVLPGGSNRIDGRFSKQFVQRLQGKIKDGVLTTEPTDLSWVWSAWYSHPGYYDIKQARFQVQIDPSGEKAEGVVAGYVDVERFYLQFIRGWSTHHSSYGSMSQPSMYRALNRLADGIPDENGVNTAISASLGVKFVQVFIEHPEPNVAADAPPAATRTVEVSRR